MMQQSICCFRGQSHEVIQMEEDVDLNLLRERESAIKQLEVCIVMTSHGNRCAMLISHFPLNL